MTETTVAATSVTDVVTSDITTEPLTESTTTAAITSTILPSTINVPTTITTLPTTTSTVPSTSPVTICPELIVPHAAISSEERNPGSIVRLRCETDDHIKGPSVLLCQPNGYWNGSIPVCKGDELGIPLSTKLFIGVLTGCCGVILLVVLAILFKMWFCSSKNKEPSRFADRHHRLPRSSVDALPPAPNPINYQTHDRRYNVYQGNVTRKSADRDRDSVKYAKPEIYSTFINPTFYEDVYERWRRRESEDHYASETLYDSPWQHSAKPEEATGEDNDMRWSSVSLSAHDNYDYGRFGKIPRSQVESNGGYRSRSQLNLDVQSASQAASQVDYQAVSEVEYQTASEVEYQADSQVQYQTGSQIGLTKGDVNTQF